MIQRVPAITNRAYSVLNIKSINVEQRQIRGTATTPTPDRVGDVVEPKGIRFKNPMPLLWQHDHEKPVGWVRFAEPTNAGVEFEAQIADSTGTNSTTLKERLNEAWESVKMGLVGAVSIGFKALEYELLDKAKGFESGIRFIKSEVMELSLVTIPANAEATISQIRSLDQRQLAASGKTLMEGCERPKPPGVTGTVVKPKGETMPKTVAEQISAFEATRAAKAARMTEIMTKAGDEGSTLEDTESEEYDTIEGEVKKIDGHLKRLASLQATIKDSAVVVDAKAAAEGVGRLPVNGSGGYTGVRAIVKAPKVEPWQPMVRWAMLQAYMAKAGPQADVQEYADQWKDSTPEIGYLARKDIPRLLQGSMNGLIPRAAVGAGTTTDATFASPLIVYQQMSDLFAEYLRPLTIIGRIPGLRRVPFNIQIPVATGGTTVGWVGEGAPKPVGNMAFTSITLRWAKAAGIVVITDELARFSNPSAEALVRDDLTRQMVQFLDRQFVDPSVAEITNVSPASITNGVTAINATGNTPTEFRADVSTLMASVLSNNLGLGQGVWIMTQQQAMKIGAMNNTFSQPIYPEMRTTASQSGSLFGFPVVASENVPATGGSPSDGYPIIFALADEILLADDGVTNIDASNQASLQMDSAPDSPPTASTNMISLWQTNMVGLRAERWINWKKRRSTAVSYISNAKYA